MREWGGAMRFFILAHILPMFLLVVVYSSPVFSAEVSFTTRNIGGISCQIVEIPMQGRAYRVDVAVAQNFPGTEEPFADMVTRVKPIAAINGTFFGMNNLLPIGDIVKDGKLIHFGGLGTAVCLTKNNDVVFVDVPMWSHMDWSRYLTVIAAGPRLVTNGNITVNPRAQGFSDPRVLSKANRVAIGLTKENEMLWVVVKNEISLEKCAEIMVLLGCNEAMNSDGGSSQALYYKGEMKVPAGRYLTNIMYVKSYDVAGADAFSQVTGSVEQGVGAEQHYKKGLAFAYSQDWVNAIREYRIATGLDPNQAAYYNALANAYSAIGNQPEQAIALRQAGKIYISKGIIDIAVKKFLQSIKLKPNDPETYRNLALAYVEMGELEMASKMLKEAEKYAFANAAVASPQALGYKSFDVSSDSTLDGNSETDWQTMFPEDEDEVESYVVLTPDLPNDEPPFTVFKGVLSDDSYKENNLAFTLIWQDGWSAEVVSDKRLIILSHGVNPYYGTLQSFWVGENETLKAFEQRFISDRYKSEIGRYETTVGGYPALRTLYEEIVNGRSTGQQFFYVKRDRWIIVISFMTYAENYSDAAPLFAYIVKNFELE